MTVHLRPHHLLCILTFAGKGYSPCFVSNMNKVISRLTTGEPVVIIDGPDDICAPLASNPEAHCHRSSVTTRDYAAAHDLTNLLAQPIETGARLILDGAKLKRLRQAFAANTIRDACQNCPWDDLCSEIAQQDFQAASIPA